MALCRHKGPHSHQLTHPSLTRLPALSAALLAAPSALFRAPPTASLASLAAPLTLSPASCTHSSNYQLQLSKPNHNLAGPEPPVQQICSHAMHPADTLQSAEVPHAAARMLGFLVFRCHEFASSLVTALLGLRLQSYPVVYAREGQQSSRLLLSHRTVHILKPLRTARTMRERRAATGRAVLGAATRRPPTKDAFRDARA